MTEKAKAAPPPPKAEPKIVEAPPVVILDGSSAVGVQPPSYAGTHLCVTRGNTPKKEGE